MCGCGKKAVVSPGSVQSSVTTLSAGVPATQRREESKPATSQEEQPAR